MQLTCLVDKWKQPPLSRGIARMVQLFTSPRELSHSAPDLVHQSVFSHKYDDQGEPTNGSAAQAQTHSTAAVLQVCKEVTTQHLSLRCF